MIKNGVKTSFSASKEKELMVDHDQYPCVVGTDFSAAELPGRYANGVTFSKLMCILSWQPQSWI